MTLPVRDYAAAKRFYTQALRPLGFVLLLDWHDKRRAYFGVEGQPSSLWLTEAADAGGLHICLAAPDPADVVAVHAAAVAAGGTSAWGPSVRTEYSPDYFAARVFDPDGNALEIVYRGRVDRVIGDRSVAA